MLASSSRHALKTTQCHASRGVLEMASAHVCSSGHTGAHQKRTATTATAQASATEGSSGGRSTLKYAPYSFKRDIRWQRTDGRPVARYNMLIGKAVDDRNWPHLFTLCKDMKTRGVEPDSTTYTLIMSACAILGLAKEARATFEDMVACGVRPTRQLFHELLQASRYADTITLLKIIDSMREHGIHPNEVTYEILVLRYAEMQHLELALQVLHQLTTDGLQPTLKTTQAIIRTAGILGLPRLAMDLAESFESISVRSLEPSDWVDCLVACAETLWVDGVMRAWHKVVHELNVTPDEGLCVLVLNTAGRHGKSPLALDALRILERIGVTWQEHHFAPVIEALCKEKNVKDALAILDLMRSHNIIPLAETTIPISNAIATDADAVDNAWGYLESIHAEGQRVDTTALNVVVRASIIIGDLQRAVGTYKAADALNVTPDVDTYNLLFAGCVAARHRQLGDRLLTEMKEAGIRPDATTYERLISLCLTQANYEDAFFYLEEMKAEGHIPPRSVYVAIIRKCVKLGDTRYKLAEEEMQECGYEISEPLRRFIDSGGEEDRPEISVTRPPPARLLAHKREEFLQGVLDAPLEKDLS